MDDDQDLNASAHFFNSFIYQTIFTIVEYGSEVFKLIEKVPNILVCAVDTMRMQVRKFWIAAVTIECFFRFPFDEYENRTWLNTPRSCLSELSKSHYPSTVSCYFFG
jgi:hypothetical protein